MCLYVQEKDQKLTELDKKTCEQSSCQMCFLGKSTSRRYGFMYFIVWHTWNSS